MNTNTFRLEQLSSPAQAVELPSEVVAMLQAEARAQRKTIAATISDWLEDMADIRDATAVMKRLKDGKEKAIPAAEVYKSLGL